MLFKSLVSLAFATSPGAAEDRKPNILLIVADDLNWHDLGITGNKEIHTPNLDKLRVQGMDLRNMFNPANQDKRAAKRKAKESQETPQQTES